MKSVKKALTVTLAAAALSMGFVSPADAATANASVYIVAPRWAGWCNTRLNAPVQMASWNTTTGHSASDGGDDVIGSRVRLGARNTIHVSVGCRTGIGSSGTVVTITPRRHNQTFWVTPAGTFSSN